MTRNRWIALVVLALAGIAYVYSDIGPGPVQGAVLRRFEHDGGEQLTASLRKSIADLKRQAEVEHNPAIQVGKVHGKVAQEERDDHWYGDLRVCVAAEYTATFGLLYDLIEKGFRIEKDRTTKGLVVIASTPMVLSAAVDTGTMRVEWRHKSGMRTWSKQGDLECRAQRQMTRRATEDAERRCREQDALETTRGTVRDLVLDMVGELYSRRMKRELAPRILIIFEHELDPIDLKRRTEQPRG